MMKNIKDNQRVRRQVRRGIALAGSALVIGALPATITFAQSSPLAPTATPSAQLRLGLDQLLGEHATILELGMQALASGNQARYQALMTIMDQNTAQLTQAITSIYGAAAGQKFESLWNEHKYFFDYVKAYEAHNTAEETADVQTLTNYKNQFSAFFASANPHFSESTLSTVLQDHINQIIQSFQEYEQKQYVASDAELVQDYNLMFTAGDYLATGIAEQFPSKFGSVSPNAPAISLAASLDQLLGEHVIALEERMQQLGEGHSNRAAAWADVMNQNTTDLTQAVASVYGASAGQQFENLWNEHMYFFTYVTDTVSGNTTGAQSAQASLTHYKNLFSQFMASANPHFSEATLSTVLQDHINQVTTAWQEFHQGNYAASDSELGQAYNLMFTAGNYLADGIAAQFPTKFYTTPPTTTMPSATTPVTGLPLLPVIATGAVLIGAGAFWARKRRLHVKG